MKTRRLALAAVLVAGCTHPGRLVLEPPPAGGPAPGRPPQARKEEVVESRFGLQVTDPYRWMEGKDDPELIAWMRAQGRYSAAWLARVPGRDTLLRRIRDLGLNTSTAFGLQLAGGRLFYRSLGVGEQLPKLMVREPQGGGRVLVDPVSLGKGESHASVNAYAPSPDGALLAYDLALGGGEVSSIHVLDVASGRELPDAIERVWGEFAASWLPDGSGFLYTQMAPPAEGVDPMLGMEVRLHLLGRPVTSDVTVLGRGPASAFELAPEEFPSILVDPASQWTAAVAGGAHNEIRLALAPLAALDRDGGGRTSWRRVAEYADGVEGFAVHGDRLYLLSFKDAPNRRLLSVPLAAPDLSQAQIEVPEDAAATIVNFVVARDALYLETMASGRARLLRRPWGGAIAAISLPFDGWVDELAADPLREGATLDIEGWTQPGAFYTYDPATGAVGPTGIGTSTPADFSGVVAEEVEVASAGGAQVPLSILRRRDLALDGSHPTILYGYGGYGVSQTPSFSPSRLAWLERGGVFGVCHVRGGGEKGHDWQTDGTHEHKMNGVHDFEACGQYLIDHRYTTSNRLAGQGASMGGILVGRAITERPDLFAAANVAVGMVNPVRLLAAENGANQKSELGDPETEAGFKAIYAMDPYQHVEPGTAYPAVLFTVGLNDRRVAPWMSAKMAARMQAATSSGKPVLVRIESDAGHGIGSTRDQAFAERADVYSFFLAACRDPEFQPR